MEIVTTQTMADRVQPSLHALPKNVVYRILDCLDDFTILCSMTNVSKHIDTMIDSYRRHKVVARLAILITHLSSFLIETHLAATLPPDHRCGESQTVGDCSQAEQSNAFYASASFSPILRYRADNHRSRHGTESNRRSGCVSHCRRSSTEPGSFPFSLSPCSIGAEKNAH